MLLHEIKGIIHSSSKKEIRKFSLTIGIVLILIGLFLLWKDINWYEYAFAIGLIILITGFSFPLILKPLYIIWMSFAVVLGYIMTRIILSAIFLLIFSPVGIIIRILRKDLLKENFDKIENLFLRSNKYHLDHKYSIHYGFINNIKPEIIGHWKNLRIITSYENLSKNKHSSISL